VIIDLCKLCQIAWSEEKYTVNNLVKWWETDAKCIDDYGTQLIPHQSRSNFVKILQNIKLQIHTYRYFVILFLLLHVSIIFSLYFLINPIEHYEIL
jgi:hypothetical protein